MAAVLPAVDARALRAAARGKGKGEGEERGSQRPTWKRPREERNMRDGRRETEERRNGRKKEEGFWEKLGKLEALATALSE